MPRYYVRYRTDGGHAGRQTNGSEWPLIGDCELLMKRWPGHLPITSVVLFSILKRVETVQCEFSRDERVLCTACEFWAAVSAGELHAHLGSQPERVLRAAGIALKSLGAVILAQAVLAGIDGLRNMNSRERYHEYIARLEHQLQSTDESVDVLIGLFAERCISASLLIRRATVDPHIAGAVGDQDDDVAARTISSHGSAHVLQFASRRAKLKLHKRVSIVH